VQPDLFVVPDEGRGEPQSWSDIKRLLLVVEGLSPSTASYDRLKKRPAYQKAAIPEYWILDIDSRLVERWTPEDLRPEVIADILEWRPRPEITPLLIKLEDIFGPESK
jgi:Uma2 family endonuclease